MKTSLPIVLSVTQAFKMIFHLLPPTPLYWTPLSFPSYNFRTLPSYSLFFLYTADMFHNITLPRHISYLFPLPSIQLSDVPCELQTELLSLLNLKFGHRYILHPSQATASMGSHGTFTLQIPSCIKLFEFTSLLYVHSKKISCSHIFPLHFKKTGLLSILRLIPLVMHIIDDVSIVFSD